MANGAYSHPGDAWRAPGYGETAFPVAVKRISWGSVFAGTAVTLISQLLFSLLGLAVGMSAVNPAQGDVPVAGLGLGAALWWVFTSLISLFLGGWTAARLAGVPRRFDGCLHGVLTWSISTFLMIFLLGTVLGNLIGGGFNLLRAGFSTAAQAGVAAMPEGGGSKAVSALGLDSVQEKAEAVLGPGAADSLQEEAKGLAARIAKNPRQAGTILDSARESLKARGRQLVRDRDSLADTMAARTGMSRAEARKAVDEYTETFRTAMAKADTTLDQARMKAAQAGEKTAGGVAKASFWSFIVLLLGGLSAGAGGLVGGPKETLPVTERKT